MLNRTMLLSQPTRFIARLLVPAANSSSAGVHQRKHFATDAPKADENKHELDSAAIPSTSTNGAPMETEELDDLYRAVDLEFRSHDAALVRSYARFLTTAADCLGVRCERLPPPAKALFWRWTALKSVHVHKKHKVQYETRTNVGQVRLRRVTGSTASTYLEYVERNLPEGVAMKVTTHLRQALPRHIRDDIRAKANQ